MNAAWRNPQLLGLRLGLIERIDHGGRHEIILAAVYEEHRLAALGHLLQGRSLTKTPSVPQLAKSRGGVHERKVGPKRLPSSWWNSSHTLV